MDEYSLPAQTTHYRNSTTKFTSSKKDQPKKRHSAESGLSGISLLSISVVGIGLAAGFAGSFFLLSQVLQPEYTNPSIAVQSPDSISNLIKSPVTSFSTHYFQKVAKVEDIGTLWQFDTESLHKQKIEERLNQLLMNHLGYTNYGVTTGSISFR